jgi:hypothetical protein
MDWPDHKTRALHLVLRMTKPEDIKQLIKSGRFGHYNTLVLALADGVRLSTMEKIARDDAWTKDEFSNIVAFARENGIDIVPEVKLLSHQDKLFKDKYPSLMFNKSTNDPRKEETYAVILPIIDEVIALIKPKAFHTGHDEVVWHNPWSQKKWLNPGEKMLPPELFLKDIERLHAHLKKRGVETWMWGDMLISPEEFPTMLDKHLHGAYGYATLRNKIPKDIVICDWHYFDEQSDFPSSLSVC